MTTKTCFKSSELNTILESEHVYLLMKNDYRISRNIRAQWYFSHLNKPLNLVPKYDERECSEEIEVVSVIPKNDLGEWSNEQSPHQTYLVTPATRVTFLARRYRLVYCLDLSSSVATVDIQHGTILFDEIFVTLRKSLVGLSKHFYVPGSLFLFAPLLYVTFIAHMPYYTSRMPQVLIQGWVLKPDNVESLLSQLRQQLQEVGACVAEATECVNEQRDRIRLQSEKLTGALFDEVIDSGQAFTSQIATIAPDVNTVNMLRYGILALQLLPENSSAGIIVITDGILSFPNTPMLESLLTQLRNSTISCSFLQTGSSYHPFTCFGFVPYSDLMQFAATATCGAYLSSFPDVSKNNKFEMNIYHKAFLAWNFQQNSTIFPLDITEQHPRKNPEWTVENPNFYNVCSLPVIRKKLKEGTLLTSFASILSCRLREGYTVKRVGLNKGENQIEVKLMLPWKCNVNIEYTVTSSWPPNCSDGIQTSPSKFQLPSCRYEVTVEGNYEFLHDVTCSVKKPIKSPYRAAVIQQYWNTLKNLYHTDQLLVHLHSLAHNPVHYTVPENIKNGVPVFYLPPNSNSPVLSSKNNAQVQFASFWKSICMLDINIWQKWMHTHRIGIILKHDMPLPKNVLMPNPSGRYNQIQCRQALTLLNAQLSEYSSFVLIENHSYIKLLFSEPDKPPDSFYIIRVTSKAPCMVIRLAFLGGTPGFKRNEIVKELREKILGLKFPKRALPKDLRIRFHERPQDTNMSPGQQHQNILPREWVETNCCILLKKPVEKILIRYERTPVDFMVPVAVHANNQLANRRALPAASQYAEHMATNMLITLSRYLYHQRWIWTIQSGPHNPISLNAVARILSTLTKIRLQEGFHFAQSNSGIINMVMELEMKCSGTEDSRIEEDQERTSVGDTHPCVVQYILFPPHNNTTFRDISFSEDDDTELEMAEADGELQLITECWVEPQYGTAANVSSHLSYLEGHNYQQISHDFFPVDWECVSSFVTLEHLSLMCQNSSIPCPVTPHPSVVTPSATPTLAEMHHSLMSAARSTPDVMLSQASLVAQPSERGISLIPFSFDVIKLLSKCQQAELLFSTFIQDSSISNSEDQQDNKDSDEPNYYLFKYLIDVLEQDHDKEIPFSLNDNIAFLSQVLSRIRENKVYSVPFKFPNFLKNFSKTSNVPSDGNIKYYFPQNLDSARKNSLSPSKKSSSPDFASNCFSYQIPKWRCFVKGVSSTHVTITVIPSSYQDLRCLILDEASSADDTGGKNPLNKVLNCVSGHSMFYDSCKYHNETVNNSPSETLEASKEAEKHLLLDHKTPNTPSHGSLEYLPDKTDGKNSNYFPSSLTLPIYVYDCSLSTVIDQLIYKENGRQWKDMYEDFTFKPDDINTENESSGKLKNDVLSSEESKQPSPEPKSDDSETGTDRLLLKKHCTLVETLFSKCFSYAAFNSLQKGHIVDKQDIAAVVDKICEESLLEINITHFLRMICGHVKDFCMKTTVEQSHCMDKEVYNQNKNKKDEIEVFENSVIEADDRSTQKCHFPLDVLQRHLPCKHLLQLHSDIKHKFSLIVQNFFKKVPTHSDYYYFLSTSFEEEIGGDNSNTEEHQSDVQREESDKGSSSKASIPADTVKLSPHLALTEEVKKDGCDNTVPDGNGEEPDDNVSSFLSNMDTHSSLSSLDEDDNIPAMQSAKSPIPPLFIHLVCSVKTKSDIGSCSLKSLPTCLGEVIACLEQPGTGVDLDGLKITLDVMCLTLPSDIESPTVPQKRHYTTSFCSTSPIPDSEPLNSELPEDSSSSSSSSGYPTETVSNKFLRHLPQAQCQTVLNCVEKIKWMLQDEIASAALDSFPITSSTLEMVADHVQKSSSTASCCISEEVPLQFVFGPENSLDKFIQEFQHMSLPEYHLIQKGDFYYLVLDADSAKELKRPVGSLIPPLLMPSKCLTIQRKPYHCDDSTELKQISIESETVPLAFMEKNSRSFLRRSSETSLTEDSPLVMNLPLCPQNTEKDFQEGQVFLLTRDQGKLTGISRGDETETEDGEDQGKEKVRVSRKSLSKSMKEKCGEESRASSVPPFLSGEKIQSPEVSPRIGRSAPSFPLFTENLSASDVVWPDLEACAGYREEQLAGQDTESCIGSPPDLNIENSSMRLSPLSKFSEKDVGVVDMEHHLELLDTPPVEDRSLTSIVSDTHGHSFDIADPLTKEKDIHSSSSGADIYTPAKIPTHPDSTGSTPLVFSEADFSSYVGSGHFSNTEDGYEGDSSDSDSERDWLNALDTRQPVLPWFWIIMKILDSKVQVYFHIRHRDQEDEELRQSKEVLKEVIRIIKNICKVVNQTLLLQNLHETRMCNHLLVPEASEDIWRQDELAFTPGTSHIKINPVDDADKSVCQQEEYLEATMRFMPGAFDCSIVWKTHFTLHHRLITGQKQNASRGIYALKTLLKNFSVNNRKDMFVYQEGSGSVFYLRLHEVTCSGNHTFNKGKQEDGLSSAGSCNSSLLNLSQKKNSIDVDDDSLQDFRPRLYSGHSDKDQSQDTISVASGTSVSKKPQQCIALHVHGIGEVGFEIREDLVKLLQKRLDDAVLEVVTVMLARNSMCKLTPEDVQFIQKPGEKPNKTLYFTVPIKVLPYIHAIHVYLRQDLLHFFHNPKYTDSKQDNHFQPYIEDSDDVVSFVDDDVLLYHCYQASGSSGSKSISCIILSVVSGQGKPAQHVSCPLPSSAAYLDGLNDYEYEELMHTTLYDFSHGSRTPGPIALIRFQIWCVGKVDFEQLTKKLENAVHHALWDLLMEYRLLTAPLSEIPVEEEAVCFSEPTTPVRVRRTGRIMVDPNNQDNEQILASILPTKARELSSSVPDIAAQTKSPVTSPKESTVFKFSGAINKVSSISNKDVENLEQSTPLSSKGFINENILPSSQSTETQNRRQLMSIFHSTMRPFLEYAVKLGVPTVVKCNFNLSSRHPIPLILKEFQVMVNSLSPDVIPKIFLEAPYTRDLEICYLPVSMACSHLSHENEAKTMTSEILPGKTRNFIIIGRNMNQWSAYMGYQDFFSFHENALKSLKTSQQFPVHMCSPSAPDKYHESTPASPVVFSRSNSTFTLAAPLSAPSSGSSLTADGSVYDTRIVAFIPRQRLLLLFIEDKELTLYLYNWASEQTSALCKRMTNLIDWHNSRAILLSSIAAQKLGLFHSQTFSQISTLGKNSKQEKSQNPSYIDLIRYHRPLQRDSQSGSLGTGRRQSTSTQASSSSFCEAYRDAHPHKQLHHVASGVIDLVAEHGNQLLDIYNSERKDLQELHNMWQSRGASLNIPRIDRLQHLVKQVARLSHYCLTPILFSPSWRWKVAPVRDHTLDPLSSLTTTPEKISTPLERTAVRSRHSSGNSMKNSDLTSTMSSTNIASRTRRASGTCYQAAVNVGQSSPRPRRNTSEEAWHLAVCSNYMQEYIQYLQTLGFVAIQTRAISRKQSGRSSLNREDELKISSRKSSTINSGNSSVLHYQKTSTWGLPVYYLMKTLLGGLLVFEVGFSDPYAYCHLYSLESMRLQDCSSRAFSSQFTAAFLDELDKIKVMMHLHSFTYDYHLRTIHSYISGRQLIFRQGYHLTSFLDDFIKYYQKSPNCARNLIYAGSVEITDTSMPANQLYNYIISHNQLYGMRVFRMVPIIQDSTSSLDTEFVLVELSTPKASYKDANDMHQVDKFDVGLLITHDTSISSQLLNHNDKNILILKYYIILTSQRELYPFTFGATLGSFKPVRLAQTLTSSGHASRKTSTASVITEKDKFDSSTEEYSSGSPYSQDSRFHPPTVRAMCDEEVIYLGYFSNQEPMMQKMLLKQANIAKDHLEAVVGRAAVHCRRDFLWNYLLPRGRREDNTKDVVGNAMSYKEFSELLHLVTMMPLDVVDPKLTPFLNMHLTWYHGLIQVLKNKYPDSHRYFHDNNVHHVAVTHSRCPETFMLLTVKYNTKKADLCLVFRERVVDHERQSDRQMAVQSLVEDFVNACCFHLWSGIIG